MARHRRQGRDGPRHGSPHGRDPGDGDPPDLQPQRVPGRHRRPVAEPRGDGSLRARVDVQGHPRRRRARGRSREAGGPLLRRAGRHHDRQPDDSRLEEVRLADVPAGAPELLERGLHQGGPPAGSGAVLPAHHGVRLREPHGRRPPRGEPRAAPGARPLVRTLAGEHLDRPGGVGDRGPDARGVRRHRQRRPADAAAHRPRCARSRRPGSTADGARDRAAGDLARDGRDAQRDPDVRGGRGDGAQGGRPGLRGRGEDGDGPEGGPGHARLLPQARRALVHRIRSLGRPPAGDPGLARRAQDRGLGLRGGGPDLRGGGGAGPAAPRRGADRGRARRPDRASRRSGGRAGAAGGVGRRTVGGRGDADAGSHREEPAPGAGCPGGARRRRGGGGAGARRAPDAGAGDAAQLRGLLPPGAGAPAVTRPAVVGPGTAGRTAAGTTS